MQITQKGQNEILTRSDENAILKPQASSLKPQALLVSIIIPAYNTALYIFRAIESSLRQTHPNIEVLVIDDGSTDDTLRVAESYAEKDKRVRVFHQENAGVSVARNLGIHEAKGEYMVFLDSDDWLEDEAVEILLDAQMKYPDKLICHNVRNAAIIDGVLMVRNTNDTSIPSQVFSYEESVRNICFIGKIAGYNTACAKLLRAGSGIEFPEGITNAEDVVFAFRQIISSNGTYYISRPLLNIVLRGGSATRSPYTPAKLYSMQNAYRMIEEIAQGNTLALSMLPHCKAAFIYTAMNYSLYMGGTASEVREAREAFKPCLKYYFDGEKKISLGFKIRLLLNTYLPLPIFKALRLIKALLKKIRGIFAKEKPTAGYKVVEGWKDFPTPPIN